MFLEFIDWFGDFVFNICDTAFMVGRALVYLLAVVITFPIWAVPFFFWYFFERKDGDGK